MIVLSKSSLDFSFSSYPRGKIRRNKLMIISVSFVFSLKLKVSLPFGRGTFYPSEPA